MQQWQAAKVRSERVARRVEQGDADRLESIAGRRAELDARRALVEARVSAGNALAALEDVLQRPLAPAWTATIADRPAPGAEPADRVVATPLRTDVIR